MPSLLNQRGSARRTSGCPGDAGRVHQVLTNEKYIGNNVYNRAPSSLKAKRVIKPAGRVDPGADGAFEAYHPIEKDSLSKLRNALSASVADDLRATKLPKCWSGWLGLARQ